MIVEAVAQIGGSAPHPVRKCDNPLLAVMRNHQICAPAAFLLIFEQWNDGASDVNLIDVFKLRSHHKSAISLLTSRTACMVL